MRSNISDIYSLIQDLSWYFGNQGFDGRCCEDISLVEYVALKKVCETKEMSIQEIATELNVTKGGVSKIIDRLEEKQYVFREKSSSDGRVCCVIPTEKGVNAARKISDRYTDYLKEVLNSVEDDSIVNIRSVLELLLRLVRDKGYIK